MELPVTSTLDGTVQPNLFFPAKGEEPRPLLVGLHTWSYDRSNQIGNLLPVAEQYNFHLLLPEFRGANLSSNPNCRQACGSPLARQDVYDAIAQVRAQYPVDGDNILLLGLSGGGHMALLLAAFAPELFRATAAFVPICDLASWSRESDRYRPHIMACCGDEEEMLRRSPISYLDGLAQARVKIFHGKQDRVVPVSQSLRLYRALLDRHPDCRVYLDIFDGGHQLDMTLALHYLLSQYGSARQTEVTG